jgi:CHAT domain-containing protein/Tfp pilus assembly protein PilF
MDAGPRSGCKRLRRPFFIVAAFVLAGCGTSTAASPTPQVRTIQSSASGSPEDLVRQGAAAVQAGQIEIGIEKYKAALNGVQQQERSKRGGIELLLGIGYQKAHRWQESVDALNAAIQDNGKLGYLPYALLGFSYQQLGRWQDSLVAFQQAAKLKPDDAGVQAGLGAALTVLGRPREGIEPLEEAIRLDPTFAGNHFALGLADSQSGHLDAAIKEFREAIRLNPDNAPAYLYLGEAFAKSKRSDDEIAAEQAAIRLNPKVPEAYYLLATAYGATRREREAADAYRKAVELKPAYLEAKAGLAFTDIQLGRTSEAWQVLQSIDLNQTQSTNYVAYLSLAVVYSDFGQWQHEIDSAGRATSLKQDCVECHWLLGNGYQSVGRSDDAREAYQKALAIRPTYSNALAGLGQVAEFSGDFDRAQYYLDAASRSLGALGDPVNQKNLEASIATERGNIDRDLGNYTHAFSFYTQAVETYRSIAHHRDAGTTLAKIAEVYREIGNEQAAAQWYEYARQEASAAGDVDGEFTALLRLSFLSWTIGDRAASIRYAHNLQELLETLSKDPNSKALMVRWFLGEGGGAWGEFLAEYGEPSQAIPFLQARIAAYGMAAQGESRSREIAYSSVFLADAQIRAGQYREALQSLERARAIAEKYNSPEAMWVYSRIGVVYEKQGDLEGALSYYRRTADMLEQLGAAQQLPELQLSSKELTWSIYENLTRITLELYAEKPSQDLLNQAFTYHERGRARALLDLFNDAGVRAREGVAPELVQQEDRLRAKISALQNAFSDETVSELRKVSLQQALTEQTAELRQVHDKMAAMNPKYESIASPTVVRVSDVQGLLNDDTVLLEYDLGPEFSGVGVVTNRDARVYRLPTQDLIDKTLEQFLPTLREPLLGRSEINRHVQLAKQVYADLIGPVRDQIQGKHQIVIVPDADLFYLPFEAIIDAEAKLEGSADSLSSQPYLGKIYDFSYVPSASVLVTLKRLRGSPGPTQHPLLAFGDPAFQSTPEPSQIAFSTRGAYEKMGVGFDRLPYSAEEVRGIMAVYGISPESGSVYLGNNATKKALLGLDLSQYRTLHFATHAVMGDQVKWITQPALIFSPDATGGPDGDVLKMSEIFNLRLNADLVVLSACETARGKLSRGEGIVGLTSAFLFAGSRSVVASLWNVNDESTSVFMELFYRNLKQGLTKADALRQARIAIMQQQIKSSVTGEQESLASPYYWAPFILTGEWN